MKVGDVVTLASGGPSMSVIRFNGSDASCSYFTGEGLKSVSLPKAALVVDNPIPQDVEKQIASIEAFLESAMNDEINIEMTTPSSNAAWNNLMDSFPGLGNKV